MIRISKLSDAYGVPNRHTHLFTYPKSPLRRETIPEFIRAGTAGFDPTRSNQPLLQPIPCRCSSFYPDGVTGSARIDLECDCAQTEESPQDRNRAPPPYKTIPRRGLYTRTVTPSRRSWHLILPGRLTRKLARLRPYSSRQRVRPVNPGVRRTTTGSDAVPYPKNAQ